MDSFWWYITLRGGNGQEEILSTAVDLAGSIGSEVQEFPEGVRVRAYFRSNEDLGTWQMRLRQALEPWPEVKVEDTGRIENQPWYRECEEAFPPLEVGSRFVVLAPWHRGKESPGRIPLVVKPGSAFGTGYHESTQIVLELMETRVKSKDSVVDVGTGSGILSLGALKLGAASVVALDLDGAVLAEVEENLDLNDLRGAVRLEEGDLLRGFEGPVDLLTANIVLEPLLQLLPDVRRVLRPGGWALFSGLLGTEKQTFLAALEEAGLRPAEDRARGEWWGVAAQNPA